MKNKYIVGIIIGFLVIFFAVPWILYIVFELAVQ